MSLPVQFQLGLELTNIVNPLSQAVSAFGSLALVDAIKKSGSDVITEMKLASLIGRHRIDEVIKWHFREQIAKSDQSILSRYVDIVLESGAGPTVQEALKNPALFSMVIQLSALAFGTEDESLANGIVEALERIVEESGRDMGIIPDYVSLLGTIRACQQQTAAFRWAPFFEDVEWRILKKIRDVHPQLREQALSLRIRALPFPVLQALIMWLQSLQTLPEHRLLHLECNRGISMAVVWCHHLLGLTVSVKIRGSEITFGKGIVNVVIEECTSPKAILMDPADPSEPLFTLVKDENYSGASHELRADAFGFGMTVSRKSLENTNDIVHCAHSIIAESLKFLVPAKPSRSRVPSLTEILDPESQRQRLLRAAHFVFAELNIDMKLVSSLRSGWPSKSIRSGVNTDVLIAIIMAFARVEEHDLEGIRHLPLSIRQYDQLQVTFDGSKFSVHNSRIPPPRTPSYDKFRIPLGMLDAHTLLCRLLLGHMYSDEYTDAVLISAWGWSVFLDCMNTNDPAGVSIDKIRVVPGVPSRHGLRRSRIIDGPIEVQSQLATVGSPIGKTHIHDISGISSVRGGRMSVGHRSDAFQVTQPLLWTSFQNEQCSRRVAFRKRIGQCANETLILKSCDCAEMDEPKEIIAWLDERLMLSCDEKTHNCTEPDRQHYKSKLPSLKEGPSQDLPERVFEVSQHHKRGELLCYYTASDDASARWLLFGRLICDLMFCPISFMRRFLSVSKYNPPP